jgi:hypothetical protein
MLDSIRHLLTAGGGEIVKREPKWAPCIVAEAEKIPATKLVSIVGPEVSEFTG